MKRPAVRLRALRFGGIAGFFLFRHDPRMRAFVLGLATPLLAGVVLVGTLAAAQAAFEVASIKPRERGLQPPLTRMIVTPGRISFQAVLLNDCLRWAYGLADYQIIGLPPSISGTRWDIDATAAGAATDAELRLMFRRLLEERFALRARQATQAMRVSILTVAAKGPRLRPAADDAPKSDDWRLSPLFQATKAGPGSSVIRELSTPRVTMRYFAEYLSRQLRTPVIDRTGLQGDFAFAIEWPGEAGETVRTPGSAPPSGPTATDLFGTAGRTALREQLGLALSATTAPVDVLVIESVQQPSQN
jgi:uncharacterized protein (TIGR03435 family)